ncbi:UbiA prenyltransferase family protein [Spirosoma arcticum]
MLTSVRTAYYLSLPVVMGAVLSNRMATRLSDVAPVHWATPIVLALAVFVIYTTDRLLDIRQPNRPPTNRHRFHHRYTTLLWCVVAGATALGLILTFFLPGSVIRFGFVLGGICGAYVVTVFRLPAWHPALLLKEPLVALLFSAGIWGSVWVQRPVVSGIEITEALMFVGIAFQNLILFDVMEKRELLGVTHSGAATFSLATAWGDERCDTLLRWLTFGVIASGFVLCFVITNRFAQRSALMLGLMSLALYGIQRYPAYFLKHERYRWLGDGVFWLPALVL